MALDNLSFLPPWLSDALCRVSSGGGFATRSLFTDSDEFIVDVQRPLILNGIANTVTRSDLFDRSIVVTLEPLSEESRRTDEDFWTAFNVAHPLLFGALLDVAATGLRNMPTVRLERSPRMADFAKWVVACEPALEMPPGTFLRRYEENRMTAHDLAIEGSAVADSVRRFIGAASAGLGPHRICWPSCRTLVRCAADKVGRKHRRYYPPCYVAWCQTSVRSECL